MNCPYCDFHWKQLVVNGAAVPDLAPAVCESCEQISLVENGQPRQLTPAELEVIKQCSAYKQFIVPMLRVIRAGKRAQKARLN